jgi:transposase
MAQAKIFPIKESVAVLKRLIKKSKPFIATRLQVLLLMKQQETTGISKRTVADLIGVNHNSVQTWRTLYINGGIEALISHDNIGYKPSIINAEQEKVLEKKLNDPLNGVVGFVELLAWFNDYFDVDVNYKTFHGFVVRKYNAKIKVARKIHIKKDEQAVATFKKTSVKSAQKLSKTKKSNIQK